MAKNVEIKLNVDIGSSTQNVAALKKELKSLASISLSSKGDSSINKTISKLKEQKKQHIEIGAASKKASTSVTRSSNKATKCYGRELVALKKVSVAKKIAASISKNFSNAQTSSFAASGSAVRKYSDNTLSSFNRIGLASQRTAASLKGNSANIITSFGAINAGLVRVAIGASLAAAGISALIGPGMELEKTLASVRGITQATEHEFADLTRAAKKMGAETEHTAAASAKALEYMAMAGWSVTKSIKALPTVLNLATAGSLDLGRASDIITDSLTAMGLGVNDLNRFSDVLVGTITRSNTTIEKLGESLRYAAPIANQLGYEIEQVAAYLGTLANAGVKATSAGTDLRQAMIRNFKAAKQLGTKHDDLIGTLKKAKKAGWGVSQITKAYGLIASKTALIIMNNVDAYERLERQLQDVAGETKRLAEVKLDTLEGSVKELSSAFEALSNQIYDAFSKDLRDSVDALTDTIRGLTKYVDILTGLFKVLINLGLTIAFVALVGSITKVGAAAAFLVRKSGKISFMMKKLGGGAKALVPAFNAVNTISGKTVGKFGVLGKAIRLAGVAFSRLYLLLTGPIGIAVFVTASILGWNRIKKYATLTVNFIVTAWKMFIVESKTAWIDLIDSVKEKYIALKKQMHPSWGGKFEPDPRLEGLKKQIVGLREEYEAVNRLINYEYDVEKNKFDPSKDYPIIEAEPEIEQMRIKKEKMFGVGGTAAAIAQEQIDQQKRIASEIKKIKAKQEKREFTYFKKSKAEMSAYFNLKRKGIKDEMAAIGEKFNLEEETSELAKLRIRELLVQQSQLAEEKSKADKKYNDNVNRMTMTRYAYEQLKMVENLDKYKETLDEMSAYAEVKAKKDYELRKSLDLLTGKEKAAETWKEWVESAKSSAEMVTDISIHAAEVFSTGMTDALFEWIDGTKSAKDAFKDFAASFLKEIAKMIMQQAILNALKKGASSSSGSWVGTLIGAVVGAVGGGGASGSSSGWVGTGTSSVAVDGWEKGGILSGGFKAFASGGVATKPTLGLIGEGKKDEAVVPLDNGQKIPVSFRNGSGGSGGGTNVTNIHLTYNRYGGKEKDTAEDDRKSAKDMIGLISIEFNKHMNKAQRPGGRLNQSGNSGKY